MKKVFIASKTATIKQYAHRDWLEQVQKLTYQNKEIFIVDNSLTPEWSNLFNQIGVRSEHVSPVGKPLTQTM